MALISEGIEWVRAFELPAGIRSDGSFAASPRVAVVKWRSVWNDKFHQVYVNGQYAGTTIDCQQREILVQTPGFGESAVTIEVFAVGAGEAFVDFSGELDDSVYRFGRIIIKLLRSQYLPPDSSCQIYSNNGSGEINYSNAVNERPIRLWPAWQDKAGFGQSRFGKSDFGFDSAAMMGFGKGSFGMGQLGGDADVFEWVSGPLQSGVYKFGVKTIDAKGNESLASESAEIILTAPPKPAAGIGISSFDAEQNELVFNIF